jgi:hypothetical protein
VPEGLLSRNGRACHAAICGPGTSLPVVDENGERVALRILTVDVTYEVTARLSPFEFREYVDRGPGASNFTPWPSRTSIVLVSRATSLFFMRGSEEVRSCSYRRGGDPLERAPVGCARKRAATRSPGCARATPAGCEPTPTGEEWAVTPSGETPARRPHARHPLSGRRENCNLARALEETARFRLATGRGARPESPPPCK